MVSRASTDVHSFWDRLGWGGNGKLTIPVALDTGNDVMARTEMIEAWNLELDAGNVERDNRIEELDADARALRDRLEHVRLRDWLRASAPGRALRRRRGSP